MSYQVIWTKQSLKQLSRLVRPAVRRIQSFVTNRLDLDDPRSLGRALVGDQQIWRYRVGAYRILVSIQDDELIVLMVDVAHRREVYRDRVGHGASAARQ